MARQRAKATDVDPLESMEPDQYMTATQWDEEARRERRNCGTYSTEARREGALYGEPGDWICNRQQHPATWKHIACSGDRVLAWWRDEEPITKEQAAEDPIPEGYEPKVSEMARLIGDSSLLMVVGFRNKGESTEVIDVDHQRFRVVPTNKLRPRPDGEELELKEEQLAWIAKFLHKKRGEARDTAVKQMRNGYFPNRAELNKVLGELEMEEFAEKRRATVTLEFNVDMEKDLSSSQVNLLFKQWLQMVGLPGTLKLTQGKSLYTSSQIRS